MSCSSLERPAARRASLIASIAAIESDGVTDCLLALTSIRQRIERLCRHLRFGPRHSCDRWQGAQAGASGAAFARSRRARRATQRAGARAPAARRAPARARADACHPHHQARTSLPEDDMRSQRIRIRRAAAGCARGAFTVVNAVPRRSRDRTASPSPCAPRVELRPGSRRGSHAPPGVTVERGAAARMAGAEGSDADSGADIAASATASASRSIEVAVLKVGLAAAGGDLTVMTWSFRHDPRQPAARRDPEMNTARSVGLHHARERGAIAHEIRQASLDATLDRSARPDPHRRELRRPTSTRTRITPTRGIRLPRTGARASCPRRARLACDVAHVDGRGRLRGEERGVQHDVANVAARRAELRELAGNRGRPWVRRRETSRARFASRWPTSGNRKGTMKRKRRWKAASSALLKLVVRIARPAVRLHALEQVADLDVGVAIVAVLRPRCACRTGHRPRRTAGSAPPSSAASNTRRRFFSVSPMYLLTTGCEIDPIEIELQLVGEHFGRESLAGAALAGEQRADAESATALAGESPLFVDLDPPTNLRRDLAQGRGCASGSTRSSHPAAGSTRCARSSSLRRDDSRQDCMTSALRPDRRPRSWRARGARRR